MQLLANALHVTWNANGLPECEAGESVITCWCVSNEYYSLDTPTNDMRCKVDGDGVTLKQCMDGKLTEGRCLCNKSYFTI